MQFICHHCNSYGNSFKEQDDNCPYCEGKGTLPTETTLCLCDGTDPDCKDCGGNGQFRNEMAPMIFGEELPELGKDTYGTQGEFGDKLPAFLGDPEEEDVIGPDGVDFPELPGGAYNLPR